MTNPRWQAAEQGNKRYTGKPCKHCGCTTRYTSSAGCIECANQTAKKRAEKLRILLNRANLTP